jgi:hypothetical protein
LHTTLLALEVAAKLPLLLLPLVLLVLLLE